MKFGLLSNNHTIEKQNKTKQQKIPNPPKCLNFNSLRPHPTKEQHSIHKRYKHSSQIASTLTQTLGSFAWGFHKEPKANTG